MSKRLPDITKWSSADKWVEKPISHEYIDEALWFQRKRYVAICETANSPKCLFNLSQYFRDEPNLHYEAIAIPIDKEWVILTLFYLADDKEYHPYMVFFYRDLDATYPIWVVDHVETIDGDVWQYSEMPGNYLERLDRLWADSKNAIEGLWT
jgi:hypothetical protein